MVVDDHSTTRLGLRGLLNSTGMKVIGESTTGEEALRLVQELRPDLVILGLNPTGEADGIAVCRKLKNLPDAPRVLVHTAYNFAEDVSSCLLAKADSYINKRIDCEQLLDAVWRTAGGERIWLLGDAVGEPNPCLSLDSKGERLTTRETEVLALMLRRLSNAEIAEDLYVSPQTAKNHVSKVLRKLGAKSRRELFRQSSQFNT